MAKHNPINERIKRQYFIFLKEAKRQNEATIDGVAKAISRFEEYNQYKDFKLFHTNQAIAFKKHLANQRNSQSGEILSKATINTTLRNLKRFLEWLSQQTGYKSRIEYIDAEYFNLSLKDTRIANAVRPKSVPTLEQIKHVLDKMPTDSDIELRNQAIIAFTILTGARVNAIASLKLKHINLKEKYIYQDALEVRTKFSKSFRTDFFQVGDNIQKIVVDWVIHLRENLLWGENDPLFPKTEVKVGENNQFQANGLTREHWCNANAIRSIFKEAFTAAELPYFNPHVFRDTLVNLGMRITGSTEEFKAFSQNLGHEQVLTSFNSYGEVPEQRQSEIIQNLSLDNNGPSSDDDERAKALAKIIIEHGFSS